MDPIKEAIEAVEPVAWMTEESKLRLMNGGNDSKGTVPIHARQSNVAKAPLYTADQLQSAVRAALAAQQAGVQVPPSYKLVPVEPTKEMILAALESDRVDWIGHYNIPESIYRAMISAAPEAPAQATQSEGSDSYDAIWHALYRIDTAASMLPTYTLDHEGGIEAFTQNIIDAITRLAAQPTQAEAPSEREALTTAFLQAMEWGRDHWVSFSMRGHDHQEIAEQFADKARAALASQPQAEAVPVAFVSESAIRWLESRREQPGAHITTKLCASKVSEYRLPVYLHPPTQASQPQAVDAELLEALREAISVCASVSMSTSRSMVCNGHTFFLQTEDWCKWLDAEVKPMLRAALAKAEKQPQAVDAEANALRQRFDELLGRYWHLAYTEGKEGRDHDTEDGQAQETLSQLDAVFDAAIDAARRAGGAG